MSYPFTFEALLAQFRVPSARSQLIPDEAAAVGLGVELKVKKPDFFVPPDLLAEGESSANPRFWLISAPAAVGKTILAQALAHELGRNGRQVLYVPLRGRDMGENFFAGLVAQVFPSANLDEWKDSIRSARTVVIFDGYDELSMTEEQLRRNERFVRDVGDIVTAPAGAPPCPSIILLYRSAVETLGVFDSILRSSNRLRLQYFPPQKQANFLAAYVTWKDPSRSGPSDAYAKLLGELKKYLKAGDDETTEAFFGHAPVLMALGDLVRNEESKNPLAITRQLAKEVFPAGRAVGLVKKIMQQILEREVPKLAKDIFLRMGLATFEPYPVEFQDDLLSQVVAAKVEERDSKNAIRGFAGEGCARRLAAYLAASTEPTVKALSDNDRTQLEKSYIEETLRKFENHPFIASDKRGLKFSNPVYEEKYLADHVLRIGDQDLRRVFAAYPAPSYYLAQFILDVLPDRDLKDRQGLLFYVLRSLSMASVDEFEAEISWSGARWKVTVEGVKLATEPFWCGNDVEMFSIIVPDGQILENFIMEAPEKTLGVFIEASPGEGHRRHFTLSEVSIEAPEIHIKATQLTCSTVTLSGRELSFDNALQSIEGAETLSIFAEKVDAADTIKARYRDVFLPRARPEDRQGAELFLRGKLKSMLTWFRKRGKPTYGIYNRRFNTVVLKRGQDKDAARVAQFLRGQGVLRDQDGMIVLDQERLGTFGVYYVKQNEVGFSDEKFPELVKQWVAYQAK